MNGESYLYALVEAGVALAGFSAIALGLDSRALHHSDTSQRLIVARLVERSLMGSLFALLPVLLNGLGLLAWLVWLISSGALAVYGAVRLVQAYRRRTVVSELGHLVVRARRHLVDGDRRVHLRHLPSRMAARPGRWTGAGEMLAPDVLRSAASARHWNHPSGLSGRRRQTADQPGKSPPSRPPGIAP